MACVQKPLYNECVLHSFYVLRMDEIPEDPGRFPEEKPEEVI